MRKRDKFVLLLTVAAVFLLMLGLYPFQMKKESLVSAKTNEISKIVVTEYQGESVTVKAREQIERIIDYINMAEVDFDSWFLLRSSHWDLRVSIYGTDSDGKSVIKDNFYITYDGFVSKHDFIYDLSDFDYDYFLTLARSGEKAEE
ncbi:MAG: hypothetical protein E7256_11055 [Lachnospiraceae bacterium]|nr:hypothetical protein [Lachnospiraceae bacterium]